MTSRAVAAARVSRAAWIIVALMSPAIASADTYDAPATYYGGATGTGATLKSQLQAIMTNGYSVTSYNEARDYLPLTDSNPANLQQMFLVYDRLVVTKSSATATGFTGSGATDYGSREHVWPDSRQNLTASNGDIQMLKPSESSSASSSSNAQRGNLFYGGATLTGAARVVAASGGNAATFFAGDADKGDVARICFYAATTYAPTLKLINATTDDAANQTMGDLNALLHWHYLDTPDTFEKRRNDVIYRGDDAATAGDDYAWAGQKNRNAYIDHPEYAWSVFADQANDTKLTLAAGTTDANGGSTQTVNLGRILKGGTVTSQTVTLNKAGVDGTYYSVTAGGDATSSVGGRYNAFAMDAAGTKAITVGMSTTAAATAGLKTGTVTVDNLDVTTGGGAGAGANDGNDVANVSLSVLDVSNSSFAAGADTNAISLNFGSVKQNAAAGTQAFSITNLASTLGAALTAGLDLDSIVPGGSAGKFSTTLALFKALAAGDVKSFGASFDTSALGAYSATYTLNFSDEDLPGAQSTTSLTLNLAGTVVAAPEPALLLTFAFAGGTLLRRRRRVA